MFGLLFSGSSSEEGSSLNLSCYTASPIFSMIAMNLLLSAV